MTGLMPKVFEEASLSGELRLNGRKLKDFPKTATKYNLSDTVIAGNVLHFLQNEHLFHHQFDIKTKPSLLASVYFQKERKKFHLNIKLTIKEKSSHKSHE